MHSDDIWDVGIFELLKHLLLLFISLQSLEVLDLLIVVSNVFILFQVRIPVVALQVRNVRTVLSDKAEGHQFDLFVGHD